MCEEVIGIDCYNQCVTGGGNDEFKNRIECRYNSVRCHNDEYLSKCYGRCVSRTIGNGLPPRGGISDCRTKK